MNESDIPEEAESPTDAETAAEGRTTYCHIRFRAGIREITARTSLVHLRPGELVMVQTEQGLEPALTGSLIYTLPRQDTDSAACPVIVRQATTEEDWQYKHLLMQEQEAFVFCRDQAEQLALEKEMCQQYGVSRITIKRAVDELVKQGLVVKRRGSGTFVKSLKDEDVKELRGGIAHACV